MTTKESSGRPKHGGRGGVEIWLENDEPHGLGFEFSTDAQLFIAAIDNSWLIRKNKSESFQRETRIIVVFLGVWRECIVVST